MMTSRLTSASFVLLLAAAAPAAHAGARVRVVQEPAQLKLEVSDRSSLWCDAIQHRFGATDGRIVRADVTVVDPRGVGQGQENNFDFWMPDGERGLRVAHDLRLFAFDAGGELEIGSVNIPILPAPPTNPDGFYCGDGEIVFAPGIRSRLEVSFTTVCEAGLGIWRPIPEWKLDWARGGVLTAVFSDGKREVRLRNPKISWGFGEGMAAFGRCLSF